MGATLFHTYLYIFFAVFLTAGCVPTEAPKTESGNISSVEADNVAISAGSDQTVSMPKDFFELQAEIKHPRPDQLKYSWALVSGPGNLVWDKASSKSYVRNFVPGIYTFRLSVKDATKTYSDEVTVTVRSISQTPPSVTAGADMAITLPTSQVNLMGDGTDPDGGALRYAWSLVTGNAATMSSPNSNRTRVSGLTAGEYTFKLTVSDPQGNSASDEVKVIVNSPANRNPIITSIPNQQIKLPISSLTLAGIATDPDGDELTYIWSKGSGGVATIETSTKSSTKISGLAAGNYIFMLKVTDSKGAFGWVSAKLEVLPADNIAPVAKAGEDQSIVLPTNTVRLAGSGTDANGDTLQYAWIKVAGPNASIVSPSSPTTAINDLVKGSYTFRLTVTDSKSGSSTDDVVITVAAANNVAPIANAGTDKNINLPANSVVLTGTGTDPYEDNLSYSWSKISGPDANIESPTYASTNITNLVLGSYTFRLTVKDSANAVDTDDVVVTVRSATGEIGDSALIEPVISVSDTYKLNLIPDFEKLTGNLFGRTLVLSRRATNADIGKVVAIKKARRFAEFAGYPIAWNGYISAVADGKATISSQTLNQGFGDPESQLVDVSNAEVLLGTNHYDTIQNAINEALTQGKKKLLLNYTGTVYVVPAFSAAARSANRHYKGLLVESAQPFVISGLGQNSTKLKFGTEDNATTGAWRSALFNYHALNYATHVEVSDMTWESADRVSTHTRTMISGFQGVGTNRGLVLRRFKLASPNVADGWDSGIEETNVYSPGVGMGTEKLKVAVINAEIQAGCPVAIFSQNGAVKKYLARNATIVGGGKKSWRGPFFESVTLKNIDGVTKIKVNDPNFNMNEMSSLDEWYDKSPYVYLYPKSEGDIVVSYENDQYKLTLPPGVNLLDGKTHGLRMVLAPNLDINNLPVVEGHKKPHIQGQLLVAEDGGWFPKSEIIRLVTTKLPYNYLYGNNGQIRIYSGFTGFLREGTGPSEATFIIKPEAPRQLTATELNYLQGGTIVIQGRPNRSGEGHTHYIHPNVEVDVDGMNISQHIRLGMRYGSDNGVDGRHSLIRVKNWRESQVGGIPYFFEERILNGGIQFHANNFNGEAKFGQSVLNYRYDIVVPYDLIPEP